MAVTLRNLRLYIFSSNMEARDPYGDGEGPKVLGECVPTDYDMYVVGLQVIATTLRVCEFAAWWPGRGGGSRSLSEYHFSEYRPYGQESPGEGHHSDINAYLSKAGCVRLTGEDAVKKAKVCVVVAHGHGAARAPCCVCKPFPTVDASQVSGRGDGSMVGKKSTTLAAWVKKEIAASVTIQVRRARRRRRRRRRALLPLPVNAPRVRSLFRSQGGALVVHRAWPWSVATIGYATIG